MESIYEYGSRAGFWRLHQMFTQRNLTCTGKTPQTLKTHSTVSYLIVFAVGMALERNPKAVEAMISADWEIASHGYRWVDYQNVEAATEREHIKRTVDIHERMTGKRPVGIYQGKPNERTRDLVIEEGGFLYDSDAYNDDLPYWVVKPEKKPHLVIPYTLCNNDMRFVSPQGFNSGTQFFQYLKDAFDTLRAEGIAGEPKMMSVGLHCRIVGQPGRSKALAEFLDYVSSFSDVWICKRSDIANHWHATHPC